jgi:hypothetical protein
MKYVIFFIGFLLQILFEASLFLDRLDENRLDFLAPVIGDGYLVLPFRMDPYLMASLAITIELPSGLF